MLLGCIGDDFTGSSDLANTLVKGGMKTVQYTGVPTLAADDDVQAGVVALKSRSIAPQEAVDQSLAALKWLQEQGCQQFFFKYCSTFDSTPEGNIGPVADALAAALGAETVVFCPAFPGTGRSVYQGYLFVNNVLLNESGMQHHPVTPMTDANVMRMLSAQTSASVGLVSVHDVMQGTNQIRAALQREGNNGNKYVVMDAINDTDLHTIGKAVKDLPLITGGSGIALGLPANFGCKASVVNWQPQSQGKAIALSGSCSLTTQKQVARHAANNPARVISAKAVIEGEETPASIVQWLLSADSGLPLVYSTNSQEQVSADQQKYGAEKTAAILENFFAEVACLAVVGGVTRIISAGGETSSAIVERLALPQLEVGPEIDPGVPALRASEQLVLSLKSGNFGAEDFFSKANNVLSGDL